MIVGAVKKMVLAQVFTDHPPPWHFELFADSPEPEGDIIDANGESVGFFDDPDWAEAICDMASLAMHHFPQLVKLPPEASQ